MLRITRILHANDFSPAAKTALKYSIRLARSLSAPLDVLHAVPSIGAPRFTELTASCGEDKTAEDVLARLTELAEIPPGLNVRYLLARSPLPGPAILELAQQTKTSLIVLGAHGVRAAEEGQLGSVATELIQRSTFPVMLVPDRVPESAADEDVGRIVTYISFAHLVEPVLLFAFQIARMFGAHLDIVALTNPCATMGEDPDHKQGDLKGLHRQLLRAVEIESEANGHPFENVEVHLRTGDDADTILSFTRERQSDVLVIESPGLAAMESPAERMVERIVNEAPCPVVVVNTFGRPGVGRRGRKRVETNSFAASM